MENVIDRPPTDTTPPALPPFLTHKRGPERRRVFIVPDICRAEQRTRLFDPTNNWITIVYQWMVRIEGDSVGDPAAEWELAHTSMRRYRQWLETYETDNGLAPNIQFGGGIRSGLADPTFYGRWLEHAKKTFC